LDRLATTNLARSGATDQNLRKILYVIRTTEATWRGIGNLLDRFSPQECANYLANAGYASA
jgi:hypothetical protein